LVQLIVKSDIVGFNSNLHLNFFRVSTGMRLYLSMVHLLWNLIYLCHTVITSKLRWGHRHLIYTLVSCLCFFNLKLLIYCSLIYRSWSRLSHFHWWCCSWNLRLVHVIDIASSLIFRVLILLILNILLFLNLRKLSFIGILLLLLILNFINLLILTFSFSFNNLKSHILSLLLWYR